MTIFNNKATILKNKKILAKYQCKYEIFVIFH